MCLLKVLPKNKHIFLLILLALFFIQFSLHISQATEHYALMAWKVKQLKLIYTPLVIGIYCLYSFLLLLLFCTMMIFRKAIVNIWAMNWSSQINNFVSSSTFFYKQVAQQPNHLLFLLNFFIPFDFHSFISHNWG